MKMSEADKIYVGIDGVLVELKGADLTAFKAQQKLDQTEALAREAEATARVDARTSALAKLSALGLTPAEIEAL
jgi:hypothetical protein